MADLRARARKRQAGYRVGSATSQPASPFVFEHDTRSFVDPDSRLQDEPGSLSKYRRGRDWAEDDAWVDVMVRSNSSPAYARQDYSPESVLGLPRTPRNASPQPGTAAARFTGSPVSPPPARPRNPSPPSSKTSRIYQGRQEAGSESDENDRPLTQVTDTSYPEASDEDTLEPPRPIGRASPQPSTETESDSAYDDESVLPTATATPRVVQASRIPMSTAMTGLRPPVVAGLPSSPRAGSPQFTPPMRNDSLPPTTTPDAEDARSAPTAGSLRAMGRSQPVLANSPFVSKAKMVSSIVDMFEGSEDKASPDRVLADYRFRNTGPAGRPIGIGTRRRPARLSRVGEGPELAD